MLALLSGTPLVLLAYGALAVGLFSATWSHPFSRVIGAGPDPPVFLWYLRWVPFALGHGLNPLVSNYLDYPNGINVMWQTSIPLPALLLSPITVTAGPIVAYNLLVTASMILGGWCAYLAFRRHVRRGWTAAVGGALFAFSPYMLAQSLGHPHVALTALCPLVLILFEEAVILQRRPAWQIGLLGGALAAAQLLISEEVLLTEMLMAGIALVLVANLGWNVARTRARYVGRVVLTGAAAFLVLGGGPLWMQFFGQQAVGGALPTSNVFVTDLAGLVDPTSLQAVAPAGLSALSDRFSGTQYEAGVYLGFPLLCLLGLGVWRYRRLLLVQVCAVLMVLAAALSLGVTLHIGGVATGIPAVLTAVLLVPAMRAPVGRLAPLTYVLAWLALATVPIFTNIIPDRLMLYVFLFAGLLVSVLLDQALSPGRHGLACRDAIAPGVLAVLTAVSLVPAIPFPSSPVPLPAFFTNGSPAVRQGEVMLVVPYAHDFESRAMLWQVSAELRFRMPEGYANRPGPSLDPPTSELGSALTGIQYGLAAPMVTPAYRAEALAQLRAWKVTTVVVGPMDHQPSAITFLSAILGRPPKPEDGVLLWTTD